MNKIYNAVFGLFLLCFALSACKNPTQPGGNGPALLEQGLAAYANTVPGFRIPGDDVSAAEPAVLFGYAYHLFTHHKKQEAVFVYYLAQLRARILLETLNKPLELPNSFFLTALKESGVGPFGNPVFLSPMTRSSLYEFILQGLGSVINGYAGGYPEVWTERMQEALEYENAHPFAPQKLVGAANLIPPDEYATVVQTQKEGLAQLIDFIKQNKTELEELRRQNFTQ